MAHSIVHTPLSCIAKQLSRLVFFACPLVRLLVIGGLLAACSQQTIINKTANQTASPSDTPSNLIAELQQQLARDSHNPELRYKLGFAYAAQAEKTKSAADRELAIKEFRKVLQLLPGNDNTLSALYNLYYNAVVNGDTRSLAKAREVFDQLSPSTREQLNPPSLAYFLQRYIAQKNGSKDNPEELFDALLAATREQPGSDKAFVQLAKMYRSQGLYPLALATLKQAEENHINTLDLYQTLGETHEARAEASGCAYEHSDRLYRAAHYYQKAIPLAADKPELHYQLAQMFLDNNHYQLALNEMDILLTLDPTAENYGWAAQTWSMLGHDRQALRLLEKAKQQALVASDTAYHEIYMNAGQWNNAALSFTDYVQARQEISVYDSIKADIIGDQTGWDFSKLKRSKKMALRNEWEGALYAYWTQKITRAQLERLASNRCERTEYYFYAGYRAQRAGETTQSRQYFTAALQENTYRFIERPLARYFLGKD